MNEDQRDCRVGTVIMAGLPETGKTTFLGALYHVLESGGTGSVELESMPEARRHLEEVRQRWLKVEAETRTSASSPILNELKLSVDNGRASVDLRWPDLSGEYFQEMARKRTLNREVDTILQEATALLFFIHPDTLTQAPRIRDVTRHSQAIENDAGPAQREESGTPKIEAEEWDPTMVSGEVLTVELLQLMIAPHFKNQIEKVAIIVSAWDVLCPRFDSPAAFLAKHMPMLHQFINANSELRDMRLYGVSALGGDPETDRERLLAEIESTQRINIVDESGAPTPDGIVSPIRWLIG